MFRLLGEVKGVCPDGKADGYRTWPLAGKSQQSGEINRKYRKETKLKRDERTANQQITTNTVTQDKGERYLSKRT